MHKKYIFSNECQKSTVLEFSVVVFRKRTVKSKLPFREIKAPESLRMNFEAFTLPPMFNFWVFMFLTRHEWVQSTQSLF